MTIEQNLERIATALEALTVGKTTPIVAETVQETVETTQNVDAGLNIAAGTQHADPNREAIKVELTRLGVAFTPRQNTSTLIKLLEKAKGGGQADTTVTNTQANLPMGISLDECREKLKAYYDKFGEPAALAKIAQFNNAAMISELTPEHLTVLAQQLNAELAAPANEAGGFLG